MENKLFYNVFELIDRYENEPEIPSIWNGIKEGTFGYIYGPPKSGKTTFCENLGISIAAGFDSYMGYDITTPEDYKVLFVSPEEACRQRIDRNKKQLLQYDLNIENMPNYFVVDDSFPMFLSTKDNWQKFENTVVKSEANIVFVDSMTRLFQGEIEDSSKSRDASLKLREFTHNHNITLLVIHHAKKMNGGVLSIDTLAGSRVIAQEADFILGINRTPFGIRYIKEVANRYKAENEGVITFSINENSWLTAEDETTEDEIVDSKDGRRNPENEQRIINAIIDLGGQKDYIPIPAIVKLLNGKSARSEVYRRCDALHLNGKIDKTVNGVKLK